MTIAVILAGGVGQRMKMSLPKQFVKVLDVPVIIYTLKIFQAHPEIDAIEIVTVSSFIEEVNSYSSQYNISKLKWITNGGDNFQRSVYNGVMNLNGVCSNDDIIMLAMSVSPLITSDIISDSLRICKQYGNAVAGDYSIYNLSRIQDNYWAQNYILKEEHFTLNMPWTFPFEKLLWAYSKAYSNSFGMDDRSYTTTLMIDLGEKLYFSKDSQANKLKLTTVEDLDMLEGFLLLHEIRKGNIEAINKIRMNKLNRTRRVHK